MGANKFSNGAAYRVVNVLYGIGWLLVLAVVAVVFFINKPYVYLDDTKSSVTCLTNKKNYSLDNFRQPADKYLYSQKDKGEYICSLVMEDSLKRQEADVSNSFQRQVWSDYENKWFPDTPQNRKILVQNVKNQYPQGLSIVNPVYTKNGSWQNTFLWCAGIFAVLAVIIDLLRYVILYVATGKKFDLNDFVIFRIFKNSK